METMKVLVASVIAVVVMVGVARFSYTPMIPEMVEALGLSKSVVGMLATVGAVAGAISGLHAQFRKHPDADRQYQHDQRDAQCGDLWRQLYRNCQHDAGHGGARVPRESAPADEPVDIQ